MRTYLSLLATLFLSVIAINAAYAGKCSESCKAACEKGMHQADCPNKNCKMNEKKS